MSVCVPKFRDLHESGVVHSIRRLYSVIRCMKCTKTFKVLPEWVWITAGTGCDPRGAPVEEDAASELLEYLTKIETYLRVCVTSLLARDMQQERREVLHSVPVFVQWMKTNVDPPLACKILLGACCEYAANVSAMKMSMRFEDDASTSSSMSWNRRMRQLCVDSFKASVWTSCHLSCALQAFYARGNDVLSSIIAPPNLCAVPNELCEYDMSNLYAYRNTDIHDFMNCFESRRSMGGDGAIDGTMLLSLMTRCTNPGSRGWGTIALQALTRSNLCKQIYKQSMIISISGMHSLVHPSMRPDWSVRNSLISSLKNSLALAECKDIEVACMHASKECVRRMTVSTCCHTAMASTCALRRISHPVALLHGGNDVMPHAGLMGSCNIFCNVGCHIALECRNQIAERGPGSLLPNSIVMSTQEVASIVAKRFREAVEIHDDMVDIVKHWKISYLGKGTASVVSRTTAVDMCASVWSAAFRTNFIPFWTHSSTHGVRSSRLDPVQHEAIHRMNKATELTNMLTDAQRCRINRMAMEHPSAALLTIEEAYDHILHPEHKHRALAPPKKKAMDMMKDPCQTISTMEKYGALATAQLMCFCRTAWIKENLLVFDLGKKTAARQARVLLRRIFSDDEEMTTVCNACEDDDQIIEKAMSCVPKHCTHAFACVQCKRVVNAMAVDGGCKWNIPFNELGTNKTMICSEKDGGEETIMCAKRMSASVRTALALEETMESEMTDTKDIHWEQVHNILEQSDMGSSSGVTSRMKHDARIGMEQRACSMECGVEATFSVLILGKMVRMWDEVYTLCSYCGCMVRVLPGNRMGTEFCCCRCDCSVLGRDPHHQQQQEHQQEVVDSTMPSSKRKASTRPMERDAVSVCRFCCKQNTASSGVPWKRIKAPLDMSGVNADLPPPLRSICLCPSHYRSWVPSVIKTMPTRVILSHILYGAKPYTEALACDDEHKHRHKQKVKNMKSVVRSRFKSSAMRRIMSKVS